MNKINFMLLMSMIVITENTVAMGDKKMAQNILAALSREKDPHDASIPRAKRPVHIPLAENVRIYEDAVCDMQLTSLSPHEINVPTRFITHLLSGETASVERLRTLPLNYALKLDEMMLEGYKMGREHMMEDITSICVIVHNDDALKIKKNEYNRGFLDGEKREKSNKNFVDRMDRNDKEKQMQMKYSEGFEAGQKGLSDVKEACEKNQIQEKKANFEHGLMTGLGVGVVATLGIGLCVYSQYDQTK